MIKEHPNVTLIKQLEPNFIVNQDNLFAENFVWRFFNSEAIDLFAKNFVWHFFNPKLPEVHGDYQGLNGLQAFFEKLEVLTGGTFQVEPLAIYPIGNELVIVHVKDRMTLASRTIELDAVVVWRIVNGSFVEAWDIPSLY